MSYLQKLGNTQNTEKMLDLKVFQMHKEVGEKTADVDLNEGQR